jgi:hypothetical protein
MENGNYKKMSDREEIMACTINVFLIIIYDRKGTIQFAAYHTIIIYTQESWLRLRQS